MTSPEPRAEVITDSAQRGRGPVTVGKDRPREWPRDGEPRVIPGDGDVQRWVVGGVDLVADVGEFAEHLEAVRASSRYPELEVRRVVQDEATPLEKGGRARAQVNHDIEYLAAGHPDQLGLAQLGPGVQPAQHAPP